MGIPFQLTIALRIILDEWQKMLELRCNIAPDEAYFYTKRIVKARTFGFEGAAGVRMEPDAYLKLAGITIKIDFKPHV